MRQVKFSPTAFDQFEYWISTHPKTAKKIISLIKNIAKSPFEGIGKPEKLKYDLKGFWSRRIDNEHRLVYKVLDDEIIIISCRFHYSSH